MVLTTVGFSKQGTHNGTVHFLRILQWWGKTAKGLIFLALPQHSVRSPKV